MSKIIEEEEVEKRLQEERQNHPSLPRPSINRSKWRSVESKCNDLISKYATMLKKRQQKVINKKRENDQEDGTEKMDRDKQCDVALMKTLLELQSIVVTTAEKEEEFCRNNKHGCCTKNDNGQVCYCRLSDTGDDHDVVPSSSSSSSSSSYQKQKKKMMTTASSPSSYKTKTTKKKKKKVGRMNNFTHSRNAWLLDTIIDNDEEDDCSITETSDSVTTMLLEDSLSTINNSSLSSLDPIIIMPSSPERQNNKGNKKRVSFSEPLDSIGFA